MRENLFRGKSIDSDRWIEGYYAELGTGDKTEYYIIQNNSICGVFEKEDNNKYFSDYLVDPLTVCQYTGKKDINGKRIFEHFIVKEHCRGCIGVIKFGEHEKGYGYYIKWISEKAKHYREDFLYWLEYEQEGLEVIGNIFDNPELIKMAS